MVMDRYLMVGRSRGMHRSSLVHRCLFVDGSNMVYRSFMRNRSRWLLHRRSNLMSSGRWNLMVRNNYMRSLFML